MPQFSNFEDNSSAAVHPDGDLGLAIIRHDIQAVRAALAADTTAQPPLLTAVWHGTPEILRLLLKADCSAVNAVHGSDVLLSHAFTRKDGGIEMARALLDAGADPRGAAEAEIRTPFFAAAATGNMSALLLLEEQGVLASQINQPSGDDLKTPLVAAIENRHHEMARLLIARGAFIDAKDRRGDTPLAKAAANRDFEMVKILVNEGSADINRNPEALHWACRDGTAMLAFLLAAGGDPQLRDAINRSCLHQAAIGDNVEGLGLLLTDPLAFGTDKAARAQDLADALYDAIFYGMNSAALFLIEQGTDVNKETSGGDRVLIAANNKADVEILGALLKAGADPNLPDSANQCLLELAVRRNDVAFTRLLLAHKADPDYRPDALCYNSRPLHMTVYQDNAEIAGMLVEAGANPFFKDSENRTPLELARERNSKLVPLLEKAEKDYATKHQTYGKSPSLKIT